MFRYFIHSHLLILFCLFFSAIYSAGSFAEDVNSVTIRGDSESPTVLYLVPWQKKPSPQGNQGFGMDIEADFGPISRSGILREMKYYKEIIHNDTYSSSNKPNFLP